MRILPNILICHILLSIAYGYVIEQGDTDLILKWNNTTTDKYVVDLQENNHIDGSDYLLLFTIKEVSAQPEFRPGPASFQHKMVPNGDGIYEFYITQYMDYETETSHTYLLTSVVDSIQVVTMTINIINYDDENPTLTAPMCSMEENINYTLANTECTATLSDPDGWLSQTTFTIVNSNPNADNQLEKEDEIFQFILDENISNTTYSTTVHLTTTRQLDYETKIFYSFVVQAKDGALHPTLPKENVTCIVNVIDLNDMPPQWTDYFTTREIEEKAPYTFEMTAVDGDKGINADINYQLLSYDEGICAESCITVTKENKKAIIKVNPIDRDAKDISTYKFELMAIEDDVPPFNATITVTFFVIDIDDNWPLMMNVSSTNETAIDLIDEDPKEVYFTFYENFAGTINGLIKIQDIDTGENAQFTVDLIEDVTQDGKANYTDAFLIVPTAGYRKGDFQISVKNATYLDYEDEIWKELTFYVQSTGNKDPTKQDSLLVQINLLDYNDELPIFKNTSYTASVRETIKKGSQITVVQATDRDAEDKILKHQLVGSNNIIGLMNIDSATGEITVAVEDAFDYDRINPVIFQVEAIDKVDHRTTVSVTINLLDVNNKAPTYKVAEVIRVDENQVIDIELNATITASDVDTTRDLLAEINWNKSYAMKNSIRLNLTKPALKQAVEFLKLNYRKPSEDSDSIDIRLLVNDNNEAETAPDYETFDTLYLDLNITDLNTEVPEFEKQKSIDALIVIYINDINDNPPIFTNETIAKKRSVLEKLTKGTIVGSIEAIDLDVGTIVEYACVSVNEDLDWFECDIGGQITTKTAEIDADIGVYYVDLNCSATDGLFITYHVFSIDILDTNDQWPQIDVGEVSPSADNVTVKEKSPIGTLVTTMRYRDADRDVPFHTVYCTINETEECFGLFEIKVNELYILNGGPNLDRDTKKPNFTCTPTCYDNRLKEQDGRQNFNTTTSFLIILEDINDHWPQLLTTSVSGSENLKMGELIEKIRAQDLDEGDNSEIDMEIISVEKLDDNTDTDYSEIFSIYKNDDDYYTDTITIKQWYLLANVDLRDYYGEYFITLELSDRGDPKNTNLTILQVKIEKFNYYPPVFVFPDPSKLVFSLSSDQEPNKQLVMYYDKEIFDDIKITDTDNKQCTDKWTPTLDVTLVDNSKTNFFVLRHTVNCEAQLQVNNSYDKAVAITETYQLRLTATLAQDVTQQENEASYVESIDIKLNFVDVDDEPEFNQTLGDWNISFLEATDDDPKQLPANRQAFYPHVEDSDRIPKHYFLKSQNLSVIEAFEIDESTGNVSLKRQLDYLEATSYDFQMRVARNSSGVSSKEASSLNVVVTVIDINNHAPEFTQDSFFGAILQNTQKGSTIVTIEATDLDEIDKDHLKYSFNSTIVPNGNNIENAFLLNEDTGAITLNFQVDYNVNGYFVFSVKVQDQQDEYGNGPFEDITTVTIYIVTEEYILGFKFENTLDTIVSKKLAILESLSKSLGWDCHEQSIDKDSQSGYTYDNVTKANIYCIDGDTLVTAATMKEKLNNINTFQLLKSDLLESGILLQNFNTDTTTEGNLESTLKTALISVSLVLGTLTLVLSVTFFLKARELKRRLNKLTRQEFGSDDSNLNRKGVNAPTTNMFTIEGSNPIFNHDTDDFIKADILSMHSGHSDLSGLEDNPEFDLDDTVKY